MWPFFAKPVDAIKRPLGRVTSRAEQDLPAPQRHAIELEGERIVLTLKRSQRRSIGLRIDQNGLTVTAPQRTGLSEIDRVLQEKSRWITRQLKDWQERADQSADAIAQRTEQNRKRWLPGGRLALFGEPVALACDATRRKGSVNLAEGTLWVGLPEPDSAEAVERWRKVLLRWLQQQARLLFAQRLAHFASQYGCSPAAWGLSSARTRWGSCNRIGHVRLNWRMVHLPISLIDYVIAHELAHLTELNHSSKFWERVGVLYPEWKRARAALRNYRTDFDLTPVGD